MNSVRNARCNLSPAASTERDTNVCTCDRQRKPKKNYEQIVAEKQLKEIFRRELRKDIFKLCEELDGKYGFYGKGSSKTESPKSALKKRHFLPPLTKTRDSRMGSRRSSELYDLSRFELQYSEGEENDGTRFGLETGYTDGGRRRFGSKGSRDSRSRMKLGERGSRDSRSRMKYSDDTWGDRDKYEISSSYDSTKMEMSGDDFGSGDQSAYNEHEEDDYSQMYGISRSLWDKRNNYLLKYYQLKKIAAKIETRANKTKEKCRIASKKNKNGYKLGFAEGRMQAYLAQPIYVHEELDEGKDVALISEQSGHGDSEFKYKTFTKKKLDKSFRTIYITSTPKDIEELREIFKDIDIQPDQEKKFSNETEKNITETIENFINYYKTTILADKSVDFVEEFVDGFNDGFYQTYIFKPSDEMFNDNEKSYVREVRKCVLFDDEDSSFEEKAFLDRAEDLKQAFKGIIDFDAYEKEIELLGLKKSLRFTKSDFLFFYNYRNKRGKSSKGKSRSGSRGRDKKTLTGSDRSHDSDLDFQEKRRSKTGNDRAWDYMNKHKIVEIFRYMGTMLCSCKPDDPIDFLINLLDKCLLFRVSQIRSKAPLVFTEKHIESIYQNMDPLNYGHINGNQYLYGLNLLDITEDDDIDLVQNTDNIKKDVFLINANDRLLEKFNDMIAICYN